MSIGKHPGGRPPKLYQCLKCKMILSSVAVRSHVCRSQA